jgi:phosphoglycerol transferase MdoB-like AlkP superfamily enzyme
MILFTVQRMLFFVSYYDRLSKFSLEEKTLIFIKGLRLDLSMSGYFLLITIFLLIIQLVFTHKTRLFDKIQNGLTIVLIVMVVLFGLIDIGIYNEWGTKLNSRAIEFIILSPGEAIASSSSSPIGISSLLLVIQLLVFIPLYHKFFNYNFQKDFNYIPRVLGITVLLGIGILMMRGGTQLSPINQSAAYFSKNTLVNHASLNTEWNFMHSVIENHFSTDNPYIFLKNEKAKAIIDSLYTYNTDSNYSILKTNKPNIVFIILESFTSDVVEHFGGDKGVSPNLSRIATEGISFTNIYASGDRTDKGMIAILSAFPSQAVRTIIQQPDKFEKLPSLPKTLEKIGYSSSFFYGGESEFSNFKSYLVSAGIDDLVDKNNFSAKQMNSKWGAHDGYLFNKVLQNLATKREPFLSIVLTLSSHEPFEIPVPSTFNKKDLPSKFRKAAHYTDQCLNEFLVKAKKELWYKNTLFVIVADHGHRLPREYKTAYDVLKFRIPLVFYGNVIKEQYNGKQITKVGSQTDIAVTLLNQLNINDSSYKWSKDLLNTNAKSFAFYTYDNGLGWVDDDNRYTMDNITKELTSRRNYTKRTDEQMINGKAYMQMVFTEYLSY